MYVCSSNGIELTPSISIPLRGVVYFCQNMSKAVPVVAMAVRALKMNQSKFFSVGWLNKAELLRGLQFNHPTGTKEVNQL